MIDKFNDFVGGDTNSSNIEKKPYIYVIEYILSKNDSTEELKNYILDYIDDSSEYEDELSYDIFMSKLKEHAENNEFDEIEDMISSYDEYSDDKLDYDSDDDDFEEKMYNRDFVEMEDGVIDTNCDEIEEIENTSLSDQLKEFLKIDIEFEDLGKDDNVIDIEFDELGQNITSEKREEILNSKYNELNEKDNRIEQIEKLIDSDEMDDLKKNKKYRRPNLTIDEKDYS